jgi:hypothetical protein
MCYNFPRALSFQIAGDSHLVPGVVVLDGSLCLNTPLNPPGACACACVRGWVTDTGSGVLR